MANLRNDQLRKCFNVWLDRDYFGKKQQVLNRETGEVSEKILAANKINSLNFWREKNGLDFAAKKERVAESWRMYQKGEITQKETLQYLKTLSNKSILSHFSGEETVYYVNAPTASVHNIMLDWDDKEGTHGDTEAAARWLNKTYLHDLSYIQPSTSNTGTHQYLFVYVKGVQRSEYQDLYSRLSCAIRKLTTKYNFQCGMSFDKIKGIPCDIEWVRSDLDEYISNPWYPRILTGGVFAKLPRLKDEKEVLYFLNRGMLQWQELNALVDQLEEDGKDTVTIISGISVDWSDQSLAPSNHPYNQKTPNPNPNTCSSNIIYSMGTGTVPKIEGEKHCKNRGEQKIGGKLEQMYSDTGNKQRVALATVFKFVNLYNRVPDQQDYETLNKIYNQSPTATEQELTQERVDRFRSAIEYMNKKGGKIYGGGRIIRAQDVTVVVGKIKGMGVEGELVKINESLVKAKQKPLTIESVAEIYLAFRHNYFNPKRKGKRGEIPASGLRGLTKLSRNATSKGMACLQQIGLIKQTRKPKHTAHVCAAYELVRDVLID